MAMSVVKSSSYKNGFAQSAVLEVLLDSKEDIQTLSTDCSPGSIAYTASMEHVWQLSPSREWVPVVGG